MISSMRERVEQFLFTKIHMLKSEAACFFNDRSKPCVVSEANFV